MKEDTGVPWEVWGERSELLGEDGIDLGLVLWVTRIQTCLDGGGKN